MLMLLSPMVRKDLIIFVNQSVTADMKCLKRIRNRTLRLAETVPNKNMEAAISSDQRLSLDRPGT